MAKYSRETLLGDLLEDEKAVAMIEQFRPGITKNPAIKMVKRMSLEKLTNIPQAGLDSDTVDKLLDKINAGA